MLEFVVRRAPDCRIARAAGVESEMELAFAGLHQLCGPMLDHLDRLPGPQRDALSFQALAFPELANTAHQELRASGDQPDQRSPEAWTKLTPQELQIARMAAAGGTNRTIGEQLYLSPRTVQSHLYRIFPKLGITARNQLRDTFA